ncbi:MAG: amidohydrolase family protein [Spirochaetota bacterium]
MIIDSHVHIGTIENFDLTESMLLKAMDRYGIDFALVSNVEGSEFIPPHGPVDSPVPEREVNEKVLNLVRRHPDRLRGLYWIKPHTEGYTPDVLLFLKENRDIFAGMKFHPDMSQLKITDKKYVPYLECAKTLGMPVAVHTAHDIYAHPSFARDVAGKWPLLNFVLVHMGLASDNIESIEYMEELQNVYGDTTWVTFESIKKAVKWVGSGKILFGTDAPIDGVDTYEWYQDKIRGIREQLDEKDTENILFRNAQKLFLEM